MEKNRPLGLTSLALALLLLLGLGFAQVSNASNFDPACPTAARLVQVPAVVTDQEGGLLDLMVRVYPGNGSVLSSVDPTVGLSTQQSEQQAAQTAFEGLRVREQDCNVEFSFEQNPASPGVDGPSAGLAMTVALRAALTGAQIRPDVIITGAILPGGRAGEVGGLIDKAQAASREGKRLFVTPRQQLYESIVMGGLARQYNFSAVQVGNVWEAFSIATSAPGTSFENSSVPQNRVIPSNLSGRAIDDNERRFAQVALAINGRLEQQVQAGATGPLAPYQDYFAKEIAQNRQLANMGYAYTSANNAFLSQVDADFLTAPSHALDVEGQIQSVQDCLQNVNDTPATAENFEWVAGAHARLSWAAKKVKEISGQPYGSSEEKYLAVRELYYARSWCEAAGYMLEQARQIGGAPLDEGALAAQANADVQAVQRQLGAPGQADADARWHWEAANNSLAYDDPLSAIYDAAYASGSQAAADEEAQAPGGALANETLRLAHAPMQTMWGRIYQSQGVFTRAQSLQEGGRGLEAHRVLRMAAALEDGMGRAGNSIRSPGVSVRVGGLSLSANDRILNWALILVIVLSVALLGLEISRQVRKPKRR